jgi:FkbM family methyltransferase
MIDAHSKFKARVLSEAITALKINTFLDNYDHVTFDPLFSRDLSNFFDIEERVRYFDWFYEHFDALFRSLSLLSNQSSRELFHRLICFRLAGHHSIRINADFSSRTAELESYNSVAIPTPSQLALNGLFGDLLHFDFTFKGNHYKVDCLGLEHYLVRQQYFYEAEGLRVRPEKDDFVIDGGACLGDTAAVFSNAVGSKGAVFAFDPVADHIEVLEYNVRQFPHCNVTPFSRGLSDLNVNCDPLRLNSYNPGFQSATQALPLTTIDSLVEDKSINKIDFIKLDVEGSEIPALRGAQRSISIFQPKLAISLYHKPNDLFEIPLYIKAHFPFYSNFAIGHYSIHNGETVLYVSC